MVNDPINLLEEEQRNKVAANETCNALLSALRAAMKHLARQIEPKVYEYGFLRCMNTVFSEKDNEGLPST